MGSIHQFLPELIGVQWYYLQKMVLALVVTSRSVTNEGRWLL